MQIDEGGMIAIQQRLCGKWMNASMDRASKGETLTYEQGLRTPEFIAYDTQCLLLSAFRRKKSRRLLDMVVS